MNLLITSNRRDLYREWEDFARTADARIFFASGREAAIELLEREASDVAVLEVRALGDLGLLKYINDTHQHVQVLLVTEERLGDVVSVVKNGQYRLVDRNLDIRALRKLLAGAEEPG